MGSQIADYTFTIIEDGQVPLAGNFDTFNYTPVVTVVVLGLILLAVFAYTLWFDVHTRRIRELCQDRDVVRAKYFFHPMQLIKDEMDIEYSLVSVPFRS